MGDVTFLGPLVLSDSCCSLSVGAVPSMGTID